MAAGRSNGGDLVSEVRGHLPRAPRLTAEERAVSRLRNPFVLLHHRIARSSTVDLGYSLSKKKGTVKLALVSMPDLGLDAVDRDPSRQADIVEHWSARKKDLAAVDRDACRRVLVAMSPAFSETYAATYMEAVRCAAIDHRADIICFNELGFPTLGQQPRADALAFTEQHVQPRDDRDRGRLIVCGSFHDRRTLYNTGGLFFPGCTSQHGIPFHKQVSAVSVNERISLPPERVTPCVGVFGLRVAVLICLDLADFASVAAVVKAADWIDLVLVPCYTKWTDQLEKIAEAMSRAMPGMVAMVNYQRTGHEVVVSKFGEALSARRPRPQPSGGAVIHTLMIRVDEFRNRKLQKQVDMTVSDRMEWLFGRLSRPARL